MKLKLADLVIDFTLYPRAQVDPQHLHYMREAFAQGAEFPLIVVDEKSKRIIDGVHRYNMYKRALGEGAEIDVHIKKYRNDAEMFLDAMRLNAGHGRTLTTFDRAHCILRAKDLGISLEQIAASLHLSKEAVGALHKDRVGNLSGGPKHNPIPLKRTIRHMAGESITEEQSAANDKLGGMEQLFYVNQLILLVENNLLDRSNERLMAALDRLVDMLAKPTKRRKRAA